MPSHTTQCCSRPAILRGSSRYSQPATFSGAPIPLVRGFQSAHPRWRHVSWIICSRFASVGEDMRPRYDPRAQSPVLMSLASWRALWLRLLELAGGKRHGVKHFERGPPDGFHLGTRFRCCLKKVHRLNGILLGDNVRDVCCDPNDSTVFHQVNMRASPCDS
jgi:hypothetical protein